MRLLNLNKLYRKLPLIQIIPFLSKESKKKVYSLLILVIIGAISELTLLASTYPIILKIVEVDTTDNSIPNVLGYFSKFYFLSLYDLIIFFIIIIIVSASLRILLLWLTGRLTAFIGNEISIKLFKKILYSPYEEHLIKNSSDTLSELAVYLEQMMKAIQVNINLITSIIYVIGIFSGLLIVDSKIAIYSAIIFGGSYLIIGKYSRFILKRNGRLNRIDVEKKIRSIQESLGSIREIIIGNSYKFYNSEYSNLDLPIRYRSAQNAFISTLPRFLLEAIGMICISIFIIISLLQKDNLIALPIIGVFALGSQKLIPTFQLIFSSWAQIISYESASERIIKSLKEDKNLSNSLKINNSSKIEKLNFKNIILQNVHFKYINSKNYSLNSINLEIKNGEHIGIIGETGSGKTTLLDILLGLLKPSKGKIFVNGEDLYSNEYKNKGIIQWRMNLAHVPQNIYIADTSIASNIALSKISSSIDFKRLKFACDLAKISTFINSLPKKHLTKLGERGSRLSGGQKQRIGIARALYQESSIIIFDEATSALDTQTEKAILNSLKSLKSNITMITVAHRYSAVRDCDRIIKLKDGKIEMIGSPDKVIDN